MANKGTARKILANLGQVEEQRKADLARQRAKDEELWNKKKHELEDFIYSAPKAVKAIEIFEGIYEIKEVASRNRAHSISIYGDSERATAELRTEWGERDNYDRDEFSFGIKVTVEKGFLGSRKVFIDGYEVGKEGTVEELISKSLARLRKDGHFHT